MRFLTTTLFTALAFGCGDATPGHRDGAVAADGAAGDRAGGDAAAGDGAVGDGAASDGAATDGAAGDGAATDGAAGGSCETAHEVTLPGHEGQFFGTPNRYCRTFIQGVPGGALVVVGTDVVAMGDHDCTLSREVRYHVDWGDGRCEWTDWIPRCDVSVAVEHTYDTPGEYVAQVFAEDREGRRTRSDDQTFTVHAEGGDGFVEALGGTMDGNTLRFRQTTGWYGRPAVDEVVVAYRLQACDGTETALESRTIQLPQADDDYVQSRTDMVEIQLPSDTPEGRLILELDPDDTLQQTCPERLSSTDGVNDLAAVRLDPCPINS